jgi:hypothetical protein
MHQWGAHTESCTGSGGVEPGNECSDRLLGKLASQLPRTAGQKVDPEVARGLDDLRVDAIAPARF